MAGYTAPLTTSLSCSARSSTSTPSWRGCPATRRSTPTSPSAFSRKAGKFASEVLEPLNRPGDEEGCRLADGRVRRPRASPTPTAPSPRRAGAAFPAIRSIGGQGLPRVLQILLDEFLSSANLSFSLFPGLTRGAVEAIERHGSEELKATYLPKMISGEWTGAMALTESSAGTDLGLLATRAVPNGDGSFAITGTKIFISSGDHDFGGNVVHLVLARLPDAPKGVRGISLFLCPKFLAGRGRRPRRPQRHVGRRARAQDGHPRPADLRDELRRRHRLAGRRAGARPQRHVHHDERRAADGRRPGSRHRRGGEPEGRRLRPRAAAGQRDPKRRGPVPIIEHPDVRKMLLTGRAFIEAARALAVWTALQMDIAARHPTPETRREADALRRADHAGGKGGLHRLRLRDRRLPRSRCSAGTATSGNGGWSSTCATPGSRRSTRAPTACRRWTSSAASSASRKAGVARRFFALIRTDLTAARAGGRRRAGGAGRRGADAARGGDGAATRGRRLRGGGCGHRLPAAVRARRLRVDVGAYGRRREPARPPRRSSGARLPWPGSSWSGCFPRRKGSPRRSRPGRRR